MSEGYYDADGIHSPAGYGEPERKRLNPIPVLVGTFVLLLALAVGGSFVLGGSEDAAVARAPQPTPPSPATSNPLEQGQLKGLANTIALHLRRGNTEVAYSIVINAEAITGCDITAFTGGAGGADLAVKENREVVVNDAAEKGIPIAFGHKRDTWIVVAQVCDG